MLYQKRDDSVNAKPDLKALTGKQKLRYFIDYYLKYCIAAAVILFFAGDLIYHMFLKNEETILSISAIGSASLSEEEDFTASLRELYELTEDNQLITIAAYSLEDANQQMAFSTRLIAGSTDLVICDSDDFQEQSSGGLYLDLSELLPADTLAALSDRLVTGHVTETDTDGTVLSVGEDAPYGISLAGCTRYTDYGCSTEEPILCVPANAAHTDAVLTFIDYVTGAVPAE